MSPREVFEATVSKVMNRRHPPESYADLFLGESTTRKRAEALKVRFDWSRYQTEEVIRMIRIVLPTLDEY